MPLLRSLKITISEDEVLRLQGYASGRHPHPSLKQAISQQIAAAYHLVRPAAVYAFEKVHQMDNASVTLDGCSRLTIGKQVQEWQGAKYLALVVCTIGPSLESEVSSLTASENISAAAFLDAAGSVAIESLAGTVHSHLCHHARRMGMGNGARLSPGHGDWPLNDQELFFHLLHPEKIGISLSHSFQMLPLKSVSFAMGVGRGLTNENDNPCLRCSMVDCSYRRVS